MNLGRGRIGSPPRRGETEQHQAAVARARRNENWTELDAEALESRAFWYADPNGKLYTLFRGEVDHSELTPLFYVITNGQIVFYEAAVNPSTWAEVLERRGRSRVSA